MHQSTLSAFTDLKTKMWPSYLKSNTGTFSKNRDNIIIYKLDYIYLSELVYPLVGRLMGCVYKNLLNQKCLKISQVNACRPWQQLYKKVRNSCCEKHR